MSPIKGSSIWDQGTAREQRPGAGALTARLIVSWNATDREYRYPLTNLPRERYTPADIARSYRVRWQVELLFKE